MSPYPLCSLATPVPCSPRVFSSGDGPIKDSVSLEISVRRLSNEATYYWPFYARLLRSWEPG